MYRPSRPCYPRASTRSSSTCAAAPHVNTCNSSPHPGRPRRPLPSGTADRQRPRACYFPGG
eukprot:scaffold125026_cov36-Phaeocystis_antarctica.AAC.1